MPLTPSHAAAVLPLQHVGKHELPLTALMIGSMAPDFGYFFTFEISRALTHSVHGLFVFSLPVGMLVWLFYVTVLEKATITLLSDRWHTRFAHTDAITPRLLIRAAIAVLLGAVTHLLWDAFTHRGTIATDVFPALLAPTPGFAWLPIYHLLQGLSSVLGLVFLAKWARGLHRLPARSLIRPYRISDRWRTYALFFILFTTVIAGLVLWLPYSQGHYAGQFFYAAVGSMSGFFVAWCIVAVVMRVKAPRSSRAAS